MMPTLQPSTHSEMAKMRLYGNTNYSSSPGSVLITCHSFQMGLDLFCILRTSLGIIMFFYKKDFFVFLI